MLNKTFRSTIIVTIQFIVPAMLLLIFAPQLLNHTHQLKAIHAFFNTHQLHFFLAHCCFYLALFALWPPLVNLIVTRINSASDIIQIKSAIQARWYLIAVMAFFELLIWWG